LAEQARSKHVGYDCAAVRGAGGPEVLWMMTDPVEIVFYASMGFGVIIILAAAWVLLRGR
jgi:hypothetical protein